MFDSYTVKKMLPRLLIAVVLIQLSWFLFTGMIQLTNAIAYGIEGLIYAPFKASGASLSLGSVFLLITGDGNSAANGAVIGTGFAALAGGAGAVALGVANAGVLFAMAGTILLSLLIGFFVLVLRQVVLLALLVIAPLALVAWILPNTEKYWKLWYESFSKLLLMFPMIMAMIAAGRAFGYVAATSTASTSGPENIIKMLIVFLGFFGPFFLIPKTFQLAGSTFGSLTGMVNDKSRGGFDRLKNYRGRKAKEGFQDAKSGNRWKNAPQNSLRSKMNTRGQQLAHISKAGLRPGEMRDRLGAATAMTNKANLENALKGEVGDYATWMMDDDLNRAASESTDEASLRQRLVAADARLEANGKSKKFSSPEAMDAAVAKVQATRRAMDATTFKRVTTLQAIAGGTAYNTAAESWQAIGNAAGDDDTVLGDMVSKARSSSMSAGRFDVGGAGFGDTMNLAKGLRGSHDQATMDNANADHLNKVIEAQGPGVLTHSSMKPRAVEQSIPALKKRLTAAKARSDTLGDPSYYERELAMISSVHDQMAASSPQNARKLAEGIFDEKQEWGTTIQQDMEAARSSTVFQATHKEFNSQINAAAAANAQAVGAAGAPGQQPGQQQPPLAPPQ